MRHLFVINPKYHGEGRVVVAWQREGNFLATCGVSGLVHVFDRQGDEVDEIALHKSGRVILDWDFEGEHLAILQENSKDVIVWNLSSRRAHTVDIGFKDPSFLKWSKDSAQLAIGTCKGNLVLYSIDSRRKVPVIGKHTGTIICGGWSDDNIIALAADDKTMTFSKASGETIRQTGLGGAPVALQFAEQISAEEDVGELSSSKVEARRQSLVSVNIERRCIKIFDSDGEREPVTLSFHKRHGKIKRYVWFDEGYVVAGFNDGRVVILSSHDTKKEKELYSWQLFDENLRDLKYCRKLKKIACLGDDCVKIIENVGRGYWRQVKSEMIRFDTRKEKPTTLSWSPDGQILTVGTSKGRVYNYVATMPLINDHYGSQMVYLSSLQEVTVVDASLNSTESRRSKKLKIDLEVEPAFVALGPSQFAAGMNNRVWYYESVDGKWISCGEKEYLGSVELVRLGDRCVAVLCDGRIHVHSLVTRDCEEKHKRSAMLPEDNDRATCVAMTNELLIYGTESGYLKYYSLTDWAALSGCDIRHTCPIRRIFPNEHGTKTVCIDDKGSGFMHNASHHSSVVALPAITGDVKNVHWDWKDSGVFVAVKDTKVMPFILEFSLASNGPDVNRLGTMSVHTSGEISIESVASVVPEGFQSVLIHNGVVVGQLKNGSATHVVLKTHDQLQDKSTESNPDEDDRKKSSNLEEYFCQSLLLGRFHDAWGAAQELKSRAYWLAFCAKAMEAVDIKSAMSGYRELGDAGMVLALEKLLQVEDRNLLAGHVSVLFSEFGQAQELFLRSSNARAALEMRKDLLQWDHAIKLAKTLAPEELPMISIEYALQLETKGEFSAALGMFKSARDFQNRNDEDDAIELTSSQLSRSRAGIARMTLRLGDIRHGKQLAYELNSREVCCECGDILESMKQLDDAAVLYERGHDYEKAASIYIAAKNFDRAAPIMERIRSTKLHAQYAKAKRAQKDYVAASKAYERAQDMDSVVEIYLNHLGEAERAMEIARTTQSARAAQMVATYCNTTGNHVGAIEFLLMAKRQTDAFELAKTYDGMDIYIEKLGKDGKPENYLQIARYYEQKRDWGKAGHFYAICCQYHKALSFFLKCGDQYIDKSIELVGKARSNILTHTLIDFLMGETDGVPKDPNFVYRLYMALGNFSQAAKTAVIIARQEQQQGNYRVAHKVLYETQRELLEKKMKVPKTLRNAFMLLHSYLIVKGMAKSGNHLNAAHMLIRVANNISKFPSHKVQILTSCVIECQRAGLKSMAFKYASKLMDPEFREKIPQKFKRKIESIIRKYRTKRSHSEEKEEGGAMAKTPSPYASDHLVSVTDLVCPVTKNDLPWCIVSGYHLVLTDWCICPNSRMPALYSKYKKYIEAGATGDPVTGERVALGSLEIVDDPSEFLKRYSEMAKDRDEGAEKSDAK